MFKIIIEDDHGRKLEMSKGSYIYFKDADGDDAYWEWEHLAGNTEKFDQIFSEAGSMLDRTAELLPNLPMSALR
jgi:hypothetical protein